MSSSIRIRATEQPTRPTAVPNVTTRPRSTHTMITGLQLINEVLSRARMRKPQESTSEAYRSARQIAISARREQTRRLGNRY
jgi:hypothetical protein